MKKKRFKYLLAFFTFLLSLGPFMTNLHIVSASSISVVAKDGIFVSHNLSIPIYSNPETTVLSGKNLDTAYDAWKIYRTAYTTTNDSQIPVSFDLGGGQWVKQTDLRPQTVSIENNANRFLEFNSNYTNIPVYSDPYRANQIATLATDINKWQITRYALVNQSDALYALDLGNAQWVYIQDGYAIPNTRTFSADTNLFNITHTATAVGKLAETMDYRIFDSQVVAETLFVKLGTDNQWVKFDDSGSPY